MSHDIARRTKTKIPTGGTNPEAIRSSEYCQIDWHLCAEATDYDCDGASSWRVAVEFPAQKRQHIELEAIDVHVSGCGCRYFRLYILIVSRCLFGGYFVYI